MLTIPAVYFLSGILIGLLSGLFGIGGGIVGIPVLLHCFIRQGMPQSLSVHMAIGTMLAVVAATTVMAARSYHRNNLILLPLFKKIVPYLVSGNLIGTMISSQMNSIFLQRIFAVFLLFAALRMASRSKSDAKAPPSDGAIIPIVTLCIGAFSSFLGLGGGILLVPYLHRRGIPLKQAIATATACVFPAALAGAASYMIMDVNTENPIAMHTGYIYWPAFLGISMMSTLFAPLGARLTHKAPAPALKAAFSTLLVAVAFQISK